MLGFISSILFTGSLLPQYQYNIILKLRSHRDSLLVLPRVSKSSLASKVFKGWTSLSTQSRQFSKEPILNLIFGHFGTGSLSQKHVISYFLNIENVTVKQYVCIRKWTLKELLADILVFLCMVKSEEMMSST